MPDASPHAAVCAQDDPVIGFTELPLRVLHTHPRITFVPTEKGGHLGYCAARDGWVDRLVASFFEQRQADGAPRARL
jgi:predicted alpha/beta-fold hydrolase